MKTSYYFIDNEVKISYHFIMSENNWKSRWSSEQIRALLVEQFNAFWKLDIGIRRSKLNEVEKTATLPHAVIVSGLRRCGKSTLLAQYAHQIGEDAFYYLNFEDERFLGFQADDASDLFQTLVEIFGERKIFIIDEIQNVPNWEHFVRRFMDLGYKFFVSGSNASLLGSEFGTRLTGRYVVVELFPFSFKEYLRFKEKSHDLKAMDTVECARLQKNFRSYINSGGIPDALKYPEFPLSQVLYKDILYRDIAARYKLSALTELKELAFFLVSNPASCVSFNKLQARLGLGSINTVKSFIEYMENSWLLFSIKRYAYSVKSQQIAPKKIYCIDTGLVNSVGFHFSPDSGKLIENIVFLSLRQFTNDIYYYETQDGCEVDFYLPQQKQLIQVAQRLDRSATRDREVRAIEKSISEIPVKNALILSDKSERDIVIKKIPIHIQSVTEWLLHEKQI